MPEVRVPFSPPPGIHTSPDTTKQASQLWTAAQNVVWFNGEPEKEAGRVNVAFVGSDNANETIEGVPRSLFGHRIATKEWLLIGTSERLNVLLNNELTNITPIVPIGSAVTLPNNPFVTLYTTENDPLDTESGSTEVAINAFSFSPIRVGDTITIASISGTQNGIPDTELNGSHTVRALNGDGEPVIYTSTAANATGATGGASIPITTNIVVVEDTAHGLPEGDRILLAGASGATGGIPEADFDGEFIIRENGTDSYAIKVATEATSLANGGGAAVTRRAQIASGEADASEGRGYSMGRSGVGRYGVSKTSSAGTLQLPRIWSHAPYGQIAISCPGGNGELYSFTGQTTTAPAILSGAPSGDYVFETDNHLVVLNADGTDGKVQWNNGRAGSSTDWTTLPSAGGSAGSQTLLGIGKLISHARLANGVNILFGTNGWQPMRWKGGVFTFDFNRAVQNNQVLIAQNARSEYNGLVYFVGDKDFYVCDGVVATALPGNTEGQENSIRKKFFEGLTVAQKAKVTCRIDEATQRWYISYPADGATENSTSIYFSIKDGHWGIGLPAYTAFEYPGGIFDNPFGATDDGTLYRLNYGVDDGDSGMSWYAESNFFALGEGSERFQIDALVLDNVQSGDVSWTVRVKEDPNESYAEYGPYSVDETVSLLPIGAEGRYAQVRIEGSDAGLTWRKGACKLVMQEIAVT